MVICRFLTICTGGKGLRAGRGVGGAAAEGPPSLPATATKGSLPWPVAFPVSGASDPVRAVALVITVGAAPPGGVGDHPRSATGAGNGPGVPEASADPVSGGRPEPPAAATPVPPLPLRGNS